MYNSITNNLKACSLVRGFGKTHIAPKPVDINVCHHLQLFVLIQFSRVFHLPAMQTIVHNCDVKRVTTALLHSEHFAFFRRKLGTSESCSWRAKEEGEVIRMSSPLVSIIKTPRLTIESS